MTQRLLGFAKHHPVLIVVVEMQYVGPFALHQQHVTSLQFGFCQAVGTVARAVAHGQYIDLELLSQLRFTYLHAVDLRLWSHDDLHQPQVVEVERIIGQPVHMQFALHSVHLVAVARHVQDIVFIEHAVGHRHALTHILEQRQMPHALVADFHDGDSIGRLQVQLAHLLPLDSRITRHAIAPDAVGYVVFACQVGRRLEFVLALSLLARSVCRRWGSAAAVCCRLALLHQEMLAQGQQHKGSHHDAHDAYGQEREEVQTRQACFAQRLIDNQVGRCTDEGEHTTQTAGKSQRHEHA